MGRLIATFLFVFLASIAAQGAQLLELPVGEDRAQRRHAPAVLGRLGEQVAEAVDIEHFTHERAGLDEVNETGDDGQ